MRNKFIVLLTAGIMLFTGCGIEQGISQEKQVNIQGNNTEGPGVSDNTLDYRLQDRQDDKTPHREGVYYSINKVFKQGEVTTTVHEISVYKESSTDSHNVIEFKISVENNAGKDVYMVYDISPVILNTREQIDYADKCEINRVFTNAVKDGRLTYRVNSKIEDIKTIRWVIASPMYNGTELIGQECDFTFVLDKYERAALM